MRKELAASRQLNVVASARLFLLYYCAEYSFSPGLLFFKGFAPPSSKKFTATPALPPRLVDFKPPLKYGRRFTLVPLNSPGARMPGTITVDAFVT